MSLAIPEKLQMARITDASDLWSTVITLTRNEIWQARNGSFFLTTTTSPEPDDGILLPEGMGIQLTAGQDVQYRRAGPGESTIVREAV